MDNLLSNIKSCTLCKEHLPLGPKPVLVANPKANILIVGQAPGAKVHASGIPWDDQSGKRLRTWLNVTEQQFYNPKQFAIVPMGFCYPGKAKTGDLPPRKECAPLWHKPLLAKMPTIKLTLLIGSYAQKYYLKKSVKATLTETVSEYESYLPAFFPMPHPSPTNRFWLAKNPWFEAQVVPVLQDRIQQLIS